MGLKKIIGFAFIIMFFLFTRCAKDFIELDPLGQETEANFYKTEKGIREALTGCYDILQYENSFGVTHWAFGDVASDDSEAGGEPGGADQPPMQQIMRYQTKATNTYCERYWKYLYMGIYRCNLIIERAPEADLNETLKQRYIGEAKFLRAFYFFNLVMVFGPVPVFDHTLAPSEFQQGQSTWTASFAQIEKDLQDAVSALPEKSQYNAGDMGRATKGAAKALLVKTYIFQSSYGKYGTSGMYDGLEGVNKWQQALDLAEEIINSNQYSVYTDADYRKAYADIFSSKGKNGPGSVFEIQAIPDNLGYWADGVLYSAGTILPKYQLCRSYIDEKGKERSAYGWGINCPTQELYDEYESGDPRRSVTISTDSDSVAIMKGSVLTWYKYSHSASPTNYNSRKYLMEPEEYNAVEIQAQGVNIKLIRYEDILLWHAEAAMELGQDGKALESLKKVRNRVGLPDYPADPKYTNLKDAIYHERRVELAMEGHRFFDLVRWGKAYDECKDLFDGFTKGKHERFPIPESEIVMSGGKLQQNPGY